MVADARIGRGVVSPRTGRLEEHEPRARTVAEYAQAVDQIPDQPFFDMRARAYASPLIYHVVALPPCGCRVVGHGLEDSPVAIRFCQGHRAVEVAAESGRAGKVSPLRPTG